MRIFLALAVAFAAFAGEPRSAFVRANGLYLHYLEWSGGQRGVLLMLAGLGDDAYRFETFAPRFTDRYRVIAMTRRGSGASSQPLAGYDVQTRAEDVRAFLDALKIKKVVLVGHSVAGDELTMFAAKYPSRVEKLVYLDAAYDRSATTRKALDDPTPPSYWKTMGREAIGSAPTSDIKVLMMRGTMAFHPDYRAIRAPALAFYALPKLHPMFRSAPDVETLRKMNAWWTATGLPMIRQNIDQFRREARHGQVVEMPYANHYVFLGSTQDEVVRRMREFLR